MNYICKLPDDKRYTLKGFDEYIEYCIFKTEKPVDFHNKLKIYGKLYTIWCGSAPSGNNRAFLVDEFKFKEDVSDEIEDGITCPYCGYKQMDSWDHGEGDENEICESCGSTYSWERVITVDYRSEPVSKNEVINDIR